jgi:hypothetical protein
MSGALAEADKRPLPPIASRYTPEVGRLIGLCAVLQERAGDGPFFLAANPLADLLNVRRSNLYLRLRLLVRKKVLDVVEKGRMGRATRFRYVADRPIDHPGPYGRDR